jgi:small subunit ribosomal protein S1
LNNSNENNNANENMENFMEEIEKSMNKFYPGDIVTGTVMDISEKEVVLNLGYKSDGIIPKEELSSDASVDPKEFMEIGDVVEVYIIKLDDGEGNVLVSKKRVDAEKGWEVLEEAYENKESVEVEVQSEVKGGLIGYSHGIRCFIPASHISNRYTKDLSQFVGNTYDAEIIDFDKRRNKAVLSRKNLLLAERNKQKEALLEELEVGKTFTGKVTQIKDFGVFVDLGGMDGLLHISEMSWGKIDQPSELYSLGDEVEVQIIAVDKERERISLSKKNLTENPWSDIENKYGKGDVVEGKIVKLLDFGVFVELEPGVDGLVHVSEISNQHVKKPSDVLSVGDAITVEILNVDKENKRISLSMKALLEDEKKKEEEAKDEKKEEKEEDLSPQEYSVNDEQVTLGDLFKQNKEENEES